MKYKKYVYLILLLLIAALNFNLFIKPFNLVCGGTQGLATLIHHMLPVSYALIILVINVIMFISIFLFLDKKVSLSVIIASIFYPFLVKLTSNFSLRIPFFLNILLGGLISGFTNGYIYKLNFSPGGINILNLIINKYTKIPIGTIHLIINILILFLNYLFFGFLNLIFSIIIIIINGIVINLILYKKIFNLKKG